MKWKNTKSSENTTGVAPVVALGLEGPRQD